MQSTNQSFNGAAVKFTIVSDLAVATTTLNESTDVSAVAMADSQVTLRDVGARWGDIDNAVDKNIFIDK